MSKKAAAGSIDMFQAWFEPKHSKGNESKTSTSTNNIDPPVSDNSRKNMPALEKGHTLTFENVRIDFPLKPYAAQVQMMKNIVHTLNDSENALLESPTGSGKSLALLCAALAWRENEERKVAAQFQVKNEKNKQAAVKEEKATVDIKSSPPKETNNIPPPPGPINLDTPPPIAKLVHRILDTQISMMEIDDEIPTTVKTEKRKVEGNNRPENWAKKFRDNDDQAILVDDDSFDDFQTPVAPVSRRILPDILNDENKPPSSSANLKANLEQGNNIKETFPKVPRIFVGSRTHKQITQLVSELKNKTRYKPRTMILGSREHLCIHPKVSKSNNKTEDCVDLLDKNGCTYAHRTHSLMSHPSLKTYNRVWDIEDIVTLGKRTKGCPYYASRKLYESAEVIFCPYNYIIDPIIRKILDINLKGSIVILDEAHNIEDSSRSAGSFEVDEKVLNIIKKELNHIVRNGVEVDAHEKIEVVIDNLYNLVTANDNVYTIKDYESQHCHWTGRKLIEELDQASISVESFNNILKPAYQKVSAHADQVRKEQESKVLGEGPVADDVFESSSQVQIHLRKCLSNNSLTIIQGIFMVLGFLFQKGKNYAEDYQMVLTKRIERASYLKPVVQNRRRKQLGSEPEWSFKLGFKCLNPGIIFRDMTETTRSVVLTSGTLSPLNTFASELETKFEGRLEANHVIHKSQVWVGGVTQGPKGTSLKGIFNNMESFSYQDDIGEALGDVVDTVPFGVLCFMPSYSSLDKLVERWKTTGLYDRLAFRKMIIAEPRGSDKKEFEDAIGKFYKQVDSVKDGPDEEGLDGALFFAVFRGKISEGIDFPDNYCRAVVTIGIPYPGFKDVNVKFKKEYNDMKRQRDHNSDILTSNEWYSAQAFRAINQALGRCIRHKNDWGAIILLEERFQMNQNKQSLSKWVRNQCQIYREFTPAIGNLKEFVQRQLKKTAVPSPDTTALPISQPAITPRSKPPLPETKKERYIPPPAVIAAPVQNNFQQAAFPQNNFYQSTHQYTTPQQLSPPQTNVQPSIPQQTYIQSATPIQPTQTKPPPIVPQQNIPKPTTDCQTLAYSSMETHQKSAHLSSIPKMDPSSSNNMTDLSEDDFDLPPLPSEGFSHVGTLEVIPAPVNKSQLKTPAPTKPSRSTKNETKPLLPDFLPSLPISSPSPGSQFLTRQDLLRNCGPFKDHSDVRILCSCCGRLVLEGKTSKLHPLTMNNLTLMTENSNIDHQNLIEVIRPSQWKASSNLVGGPISTCEWPNEATVTLNAEDGVCYRLFHCMCCKSKPQGVILRQPISKNEVSEFDGRVFIWASQLSIQKHLNYQPEDKVKIPSSQIPSMNDMFYDL